MAFFKATDPAQLLADALLTFDKTIYDLTGVVDLATQRAEAAQAEINRLVKDRATNHETADKARNVIENIRKLTGQ